MRIDRLGLALSADSFSVDEMERFWSQVDVGSEDECWGWRGYANPYGGLKVRRDGKPKRISSHKIAFVLSKRALIAGEIIRHKCDNPRCSNPSHLVAGTQAENIRDKVAKNRQAKGMAHGMVKLTPEQVVAINDDPRQQRAIATDYGISQRTVGRIKHGKSWREIAR